MANYAIIMPSVDTLSASSIKDKVDRRIYRWYVPHLKGTESTLFLHRTCGVAVHWYDHIDEYRFYDYGGPLV